jgi:hypothetical protein
VVVGFGGGGIDVVIRLMDVKDRRQRASALPVPVPQPVGMRSAIVARRYA